jgi:hypothetical protein
MFNFDDSSNLARDLKKYAKIRDGRGVRCLFRVR